MKSDTELDRRVEKILSDAKKRLQNMDWQKRYGSYFEALLCECAKDTLVLIEQQQKSKNHGQKPNVNNKPPPSLRLFETYQPDVVLYDVLGDVVCGGFAAPIREGYAEQVLIVTSGEKMALYAANNINNAVKNFEDRSYAKVRGLILNRRNVTDEESKVRAFAESAGLSIAADIPRSDDITKYEDTGKTVIEGNPGCETAKRFFALADLLIGEEAGI